MSRVGKLPIKIPDGVSVNISEQNVTVECSNKQLSYQLPDIITLSKDGEYLKLNMEGDTPATRSLYGLSRALINNMIIGVKEGFTKDLEMVGRGKRAKVQGKSLILEIGLSHSVDFKFPDDIEIKVEKNILSVSGIDKQRVGEVAAEIRDLQPPEPYKGAGIRYKGERVRKKAGKTAVGGGFSGGGK